MRKITPFSIHPEGYSVLGAIAIFGFVSSFVAWWHTGFSTWFYFLMTSTLLLLLFFTVFFRNPRRRYKLSKHSVLAPADGRVVAIEEEYEKEYFKKPMLKISIFMPPWSPHMNKAPVSGKVKYVKYHPGRYLVAWHPKSSEENERNTIVIEREDGIQVLIRQIAGFLARRVKCYLKTGDYVIQGKDIGFIKLGSRTDIYLPLDAKVLVEYGERVKAGVTEIAFVPIEKCKEQKSQVDLSESVSLS